jgi:single-strand DNA-binding protein
MRNQTEITIVGNLVQDPELRFTPNGNAVCKFNVAVTPRTFDRTSGQWTDGEAAFWTVTAWRTLAENIAASLSRGNQVIVSGRVKSESWEDRETGKTRSRMVIDADVVGASLDYATVTVRKMTRSNGGNDPEWETASRVRPATAETASDASEPVGGDSGTYGVPSAPQDPPTAVQKATGRKAPQDPPTAIVGTNDSPRS